MPLYIGDYLADTSHLSTEEHGAYLLLIMAYWRNKGPLLDDDEEFTRTTKLMRDAWLRMRPRIARFFQVKDGWWHHKRVDAEMAESLKNRASRASAASSAAKARWEKENQLRSQSEAGCVTHASRNASRMRQHASSPSPSPEVLKAGEPTACARGVQANGPTAGKPMPERAPEGQANAVGSAAVEANRPTWEEVWAFAQTIGLAEWKARDWLDEMCMVGWIDWQKRPVQSWKHMLTRVCRKWEADGRPMGPPQTRSQANATSKPDHRADRRAREYPQEIKAKKLS